MRIARSFAFSAAAAAAGLIVAAPALAADAVVPLKTPHTNTLAENDQQFEQDCEDERFEVRKTNEDGWHFLMPSGSFTSIKITFDPDGAVDNDSSDDVVKEGTPSAPGPFTFYTVGNAGNYQHAYLFTPAGWLLVSGTSTATGVKDGATFNISHACAGTKTPPGTPTPSPSDDPDTDPSGDPSGDPSDTPPAGGGGGGLPLTGAATTLVVAAGIGLVAGGVGLLMVRRRRDLA
jgi:LPXTG-motif cell wall-anchored protein